MSIKLKVNKTEIENLAKNLNKALVSTEKTLEKKRKDSLKYKEESIRILEAKIKELEEQRDLDVLDYVDNVYPKYKEEFKVKWREEEENEIKASLFGWFNTIKRVERRLNERIEAAFGCTDEYHMQLKLSEQLQQITRWATSIFIPSAVVPYKGVTDREIKDTKDSLYSTISSGMPTPCNQEVRDYIKTCESILVGFRVDNTGTIEVTGETADIITKSLKLVKGKTK